MTEHRGLQDVSAGAKIAHLRAEVDASQAALSEKLEDNYRLRAENERLREVSDGQS